MKTATRSFNKTIALVICALLALTQIQLVAFSSDYAYADETTRTSEITQADSNPIASGYVGENNACRYEIDADYKMRIYPTNGTSAVLNGPNNQFIKAFPETVNTEPIRKFITEVVIEPSVKLGENINYLFSGFENLTTINTAEWDVSAVKNMSHLFENCRALETVDVSSWTPSNVTNMEYMFATCPSLKIVNVGAWGEYTGNVTNMAGMFNGCQNLTSVDLSNWNTKNVTNMNRIFSGCRAMNTEWAGQYVLYVVGSENEAQFPIDKDKYWYSPQSKKYFTPEEIIKNRSGIEDLYIAVNEMATHITIEGATVPKVGEPIKTETLIITAKVGSRELTQTRQAVWSNGAATQDTVFQPGKTYSLSVHTELNNRNVFAEGCTVSAPGFSKVTYSDSTSSEPSLGTVARNYTIEYITPGTSGGSGSSGSSGDSGNGSLSTADTDAMYRLYNPNSGEHFYTASTVEREFLVGQGWTYEGIGWYAPKTGDPVYRLYNPNAGDHHYTQSTVERDWLVTMGWTYEGIGWNSGSGSPLYRLYNPNAVAGAHHYTLSAVERDWLVPQGWKYEGICWNSR